MKKWLITGLVVLTLVAAGVSVHWWLRLLPFFRKNSDLIQGLSGAIQIVLWLGAGLAFVIGLLRSGKKAQDPSGGVNVSQSAETGGVNVIGEVDAGGDLVGRDKVTIIQVLNRGISDKLTGAEEREIENKTDLELVDVSFVEEPWRRTYGQDFPTLDIKLRNIGEKVIFIKNVVFNVHKVWNIRPPTWLCGVVQSSAKYDIYLPSKGAPYAQSTSISHSIRENDVDRFMVALNIDGDCVYLVTFNLIYDGDEKSISSGQLLAFRAEASSIYSLSHLSHRSGQSDSLELGQVAWIFHDRKTLDEVGAIGGIRNQALLDMERFIRGSLPYLEKTLAPYKRRLIDLTDGEIASVNEIEGLLDPELGIVIKSFALVSARMTDEALSHLRYMTKLQCLDLSHCREVTDRGLVDIRHLTNLQRLDLNWTGITDVGLESVGRLENLEALGLTETKVGDAGLVHLEGLRRLRFLNLARTQITDEGLRYLCALTGLEMLDISGCRVTSTGLVHLKSLKTLKVRVKSEWVSINDVL